MTNETARPPKVAIITLNYDTPQMTDALAHYLNHDLHYLNKKVYVIDNGSRTVATSTTHALPENLGFTKGMYEGYRIAAGEDDYDAFWFLNSDVGFEFGNDVLGQLVEVLFSSPSFGQIAPQHNSPHKFMERAYLTAQPVPYLEAIATLIKASTLAIVGFWELTLTYGWGVDYDYGYRVRAAGLLNILTNRARITHKEHQSIGDLSAFIREASAEMNDVLRRKYGEDWGNIKTMSSKIVPLILSCDRDVELTKAFVASYRTVQSVLAKPIVIIDTSAAPRLSTKYLALIASLDPQAVFIHSRPEGMNFYDSVQDAAAFCCRQALEVTGGDDRILFLEDDIVFSRHFSRQLVSLETPADAGFITFYQPGRGYGSRVIDPEHFYGTQCLLFPRRSLAEIVENLAYIYTHLPPGYDIRWSRFLAERGYKLYCTDHSYVQHLRSTSRLHGQGSHVSDCYRD